MTTTGTAWLIAQPHPPLLDLHHLLVMDCWSVSTSHSYIQTTTTTELIVTVVTITVITISNYYTLSAVKTNLHATTEKTIATTTTTIATTNKTTTATTTNHCQMQ